VRIFGVISLPSHRPFLVLELRQGGSLRALLDRVHDNLTTNLSWNKRVKFLKEIAVGMVQLHSLTPNPIIHRDLKAANVLLSSVDPNLAVVKVADFGAAIAMVQTLKCTFSAGAALARMAPEVFDGKFSQKSDVFSFAVLTFEMVSLKLPHDDKSPQEITDLVRERFKVNKRRENSGVSAAQQEENGSKTIHSLNVVRISKKCNLPDVVEFLRKLYEGRPYWGQGGDDVRIVLPDGKEKEMDSSISKDNRIRSRESSQGVQNKNLWDPFAAKRQTMRTAWTRSWLKVQESTEFLGSRK
jgi:serine/threonine protein kinase